MISVDRYGQAKASGDERELAADIEWLLEDHFQINRNVRGVNLLTDKTVVPDLVLRPRPSLTEAGFPDGLICVEIKAIPASKPSRRGREMAWQAFTYRMSRYSGELPIFSLVFPSVRQFFKAEGTDDYCRLYKDRCDELMTIMQYGNVGCIDFVQNEFDEMTGKPNVEFNFNNALFWTSFKGRECYTPNAGVKIRVGTKQQGRRIAVVNGKIENV